MSRLPGADGGGALRPSQRRNRHPPPFRDHDGRHALPNEIDVTAAAVQAVPEPVKRSIASGIPARIADDGRCAAFIAERPGR